MKKKLSILITFGLLFACSNEGSNEDHNNTETELIGNWKLIEVLADPGNGNGTFRSVESDRTIEFKVNGTVTTNGSLCDPFSEETISSGTYNEDIITTNCQNPNIATIGFELDGQFLILNFISNEGYSQKFEKIKG